MASGKQVEQVIGVLVINPRDVPIPFLLKEGSSMLAPVACCCLILVLRWILRPLTRDRLSLIKLLGECN